MFFSFASIFSLLFAYRYFALFVIMVVEGPIITVIGGFLSSVGALNLYVTFAVVVIGDVVGDSIYYALGRWGRWGFIDRWGHYVGITRERVEKIERHFDKHSGKTLVLGKLTHAIGSIILFAAGVSRMSYWRFLWFNFVATLPKSLLFILVGFYFGASLMRINRILNITTLVMLGLFGIMIITFLGMRVLAKRLDQEL